MKSSKEKKRKEARGKGKTVWPERTSIPSVMDKCESMDEAEREKIGLPAIQVSSDIVE